MAVPPNQLEEALAALRESEQRLQQRADELQALYSTSMGLAAERNTNALLRQIVEQAMALIHAEGGGLMLHDAQRDDLYLSVMVELPVAMSGMRVRPGEGLSGRAYAERRTVVVEDYPAWAGSVPAAAQAIAASRASANMMSVPLLTSTGALGVLIFANFSRPFDEHDVWLAELFAAQAAVAMENARLQEDLQRQARELEAINTASRAIAASLDLPVVLNILIAEVRTLVNAEGASVLLYEPNEGAPHGTGELVFAAAAGPGAENLRGMCIPATSGIAGAVLVQAQPIVVDDAQQDTRFYRQVDNTTGLTTRTLLAMPLIARGNTLGVVEAINKIDGAFTTRDLDMLSDLAGAASIAIDNARLYQAEREQYERLQQSQAQLLQAEKMGALGRLVASITHEINNPLQAIMGWLELSLDDLEGRPDLQAVVQYLRSADNEMQRVARLLQRLRDFYRPGRVEPRPLEITAVLDDVLALAAKHLQHNRVTVERAWPDRLPRTRADAQQLQQVFLNLVLNAADAMAQTGGTLRVSAAPAVMRAGAAGAGRPAVRVDFTDNGPGVPPEILPHLFEPFVTSKPSNVGLGLYISYGIIKFFGGEISVSSRSGQGTTFTIFLPATTEPAI